RPAVSRRSCLRAAPLNGQLGRRDFHPRIQGLFRHTIRQRYERSALIVTSNRALKEWPPLFHDPLLAGAALDRLLHHAEVLVLEGHSHRDPRRRTKPAPKPSAA